MPLKGHGQFFVGDAASVVFYGNQADTAPQQAQGDMTSARVERVVDQFSHHGGRAFNDLTCCDLADQHIGEFTNGSSGGGLRHPQIVGALAGGPVTQSCAGRQR